MGRYSIKSSECTKEELEKMYLNIKNNLGDSIPKEYIDDLDKIFNIAKENQNLFPSKNIREHTPREYLDKWVQGYIDERLNPPSRKQAQPKQTCTDPVLKEMVNDFWQNERCAMDDLEKIHNLFMSAENILGHLLEEFIADRIRPYGWIWCAGETLKAVDFCAIHDRYLLQIKNKDNSENSSSSQIRNNTKIEKWNRLKTQVRKNVTYPKYNWERLTEIINKHSCGQLSPFSITEDEYKKWVMKVIRDNPRLISAS